MASLFRFIAGFGGGFALGWFVFPYSVALYVILMIVWILVVLGLSILIDEYL